MLLLLDMLFNTIAKLIPGLSGLSVRQQWVKNQLEKLPSGSTLLDAGAGECQYKKYCSQLKYTSQDFSEYDGKNDTVGLQTGTWDVSQIDIVSDILKIPVQDSSFDTILCTEVFEHIPYPDLAVKEFSRILKKGGKLILTAPFASQTHFSPYHFCTGFNIYWYQTVLSNYGMEIEIVERNGNFFDYLSQETMRLPLMVKRYTFLSYFGYLFALISAPVAIILSILSFIQKNSETQLCFGYHILARKK